MAAAGAGGHGEHGDEAGEHVGQRDEQHRGGVRADDLAEGGGQGLVHQLGEVLVGELAALGASGGAGGVDDRGQVLQVRGRTAGLEVLVAHVRAESRQLVEAGARLTAGDVHGPHAAQLGQVLPVDGVAHRLDEGLVPGDDGAHVRVLDDPGHLGGRGGLVDRHGDGAGVPDGEVHERPLEPGGGHQAHAVARADAGGDQALGQGAHPLAGVPRGDVRPLVLLVRHGEEAVVGALLGLALEEVGDVRLGGQARVVGLTDLSHGAPRLSRRPAVRPGPGMAVRSALRDGA